MKELKDYKLKDVKYYIEGRESRESIKEAKTILCLTIISNALIFTAVVLVTMYADVIDELFTPFGLISFAAVVAVFVIYASKKMK